MEFGFNVSVVAPGKERTVAFVFKSLFLIVLNIELPTNNVDSLILFFVSRVKSIGSESMLKCLKLFGLRNRSAFVSLFDVCFLVTPCLLFEFGRL